jgi:hypothetical protein
MDISVKAYTPVPFILNAIYDTLVFIAISLRIVSRSLAGDTFGAYMRSFLRGDGLPVLSKSVMQGGQLYYSFVTKNFFCESTFFYWCFFLLLFFLLLSVTIGFNIVVVILIFAPVPDTYHSILLPAQFTLNCVMACRVFRGIKLGTIQCVDGSSTFRGTLGSAGRTDPASHAAASNEFALTLGPGRRTVPVDIEVTKNVESGDPGQSLDPKWNDGKLVIAFDQV